jgi:two-component system phosphate regulon response regulator PhoB
MAGKQILIVEDEKPIRDMIAFGLRRAGFDVREAEDCTAARASIADQRPDLLLVDWMLPDQSGLDLTRAVKRNKDTEDMPVIMLTARADEHDKVSGLEGGADDYVTKPFSLSVLVARVAAVLRRTVVSRKAGKGPLTIGPITVDADRHLVQVDGEAVTLTLTEFRLLTALMAARGRVLARNQLIDQAMGIHAIVTDRTIDVHLTALRRKLGKARSYLETVRGIGYRMRVEGEGSDDTA